MKAAFYFSFFFLLLLGNFVFSQPLPEQDCIAAIPVCQDTFIQNTPYVGIGSPSAGQGINGNEINFAISCMTAGEKNDVWYTFTVQTSGNLCFKIIPNDTTDDFDWAVFNLTNSPCDSIFTDASLEVSCNYSSLPGITGPVGDTLKSQHELCIPVISGENYVINVSQFTTSPNGYILDFSTSTAQLYDNIPPVMDSVTTPITCGDTQLIVIFSENVFCSTVQPTDFILTGPSGPVSITNVTSVGCTSGSTYDDQYILTVSPAISPIGNFSLVVLANADVQDLCNNPNIKADTINFSISPFSVYISTTPQLCSANNGTATVDSSGGISPHTYSWNSSPPQNTATAAGLIPGVYTVTVTDAVGCVSSGSGNVGFDPGANPPVATISASTNATCSGMNDGSATVNATGGTTPYVYIWSDNQTTITATGLGTGTIICTVTDNNGCFDTASVLISGGIPIVITATPDTFICKGSSATLFASVTGGANPYSYTWLVNGFIEGTNIPHQVSPVATTIYNVFATDNAGCISDTDLVTVNVHPLLDVTILPVSIICPGETKQLEANGGGGKGSGYSYSWSTTDTGRIIYVSPLVNTTFYVSVTDNCTAVDGIGSIDVLVGQPPPTLKIFADPLKGCVPLEVQFHIEPFIQGYIYMWNFGDGNLQNTLKDTVKNTYQTEGCKDVTLVFITNENCPYTIIDSCMINPLPSPTAEFIFSPSVPNTLNPIVNFFDRSTGADSWQWDLGDNSISNYQNVQHEYSDSGSYLVKLVVSNDSQCTDTVEHIVIVDFETTLYIPNSFTPNEDELNDLFIPVFEGIKPDSFNMYIFDRWGKIVFRSDSFNKPWDGKINGNYAQDGVYIYFIKYKTLKGEEKKIRGSVTMLK